MTVYIVQEPKRRDPETGKMIAKHDLSPARKFGRLEVLIPASTGQDVDPSLLVEEIRKRLKNFNDQDYLLLGGDPVAIAIAAIIASEVNSGFVRLLRWDRMSKAYTDMVLNTGYNNYLQMSN